MTEMQNGSRRIGYYGAYENMRGVPAAALAADMAHALAQEYDVGHMSRNEYSLLLRGLRNSGVITAQEFSAGYGGTLPRAGVPGAGYPEALPLGEHRADFIGLFRQYVQYCGDFLKTSVTNHAEQDHVQSLLSAYSHLYALFGQIHAARTES